MKVENKETNKEINKEAITELFENLYMEDGYNLAASASILIPWFQCTLRCQCKIEQKMTELDGIICKLVKRGINSAEDIAFLLALDTRIVAGKIEELRQAGIFHVDNNIVKLTEIGEASFANYTRLEMKTMDFNVYMNAVTGEWSCDGNRLLQEKEILKETIKLQPMKSVVKLDIENNSYIKEELQEINETHIVILTLLDYKVITYFEEKILFYKNDENKILFSLFDMETESQDLETADALMSRYHRRELFEIMQVEKYIKQAEEAILEKEVQDVGYVNAVNEHKYYQNREIRELFKNIFDFAQTSIFIVSPWIDNNNYVMTETLLKKIQNALDRNIEITIGYGYISKTKMENKIKDYSQTKDIEKIRKDRDYQTYLMAVKMRERFRKYPNFSMLYLATHEKILSYDERYTLIGSFNLLSYDGGENNNYGGKNFRLEGGVMINDPEFAKHIKEKFARNT